MKRILLSVLCFGALSVGAQTNTFTAGEIILYTVRHADLHGDYIRITPNGWSLFGSVTAHVEMWNTNGIIISKANVVIENNEFRIWAQRAATNKALATKQLAVYLAKQVNLTNSPAASDQPVEE